jgi:GNAT superfamily N-acetyltransferase
MASTPVVIERAPRSSDVPNAISALTTAFVNDPAARWLFPDPAEYLANFPFFVSAFGGRAFAEKSADVLENGLGAALWLPPGIHSDHAALDALFTNAPAALQAEMSFLFERIDYYCPKEPYWDLPLIGVDPRHQNSGHGSALLKQGLRRCDRDHLAAYVQATSTSSFKLYHRHGFEPVGEIQSGMSPTFYAMVRAAR